MKTCAKCGETKPIERFPRDRRRPDGRFSYCKMCHSGYQRTWAGGHPDEIKERRRKSRERLRAWRLANPELHRQTTRMQTQMRRYGLQVEDYFTMLAAQGGVCALASCNARPEDERHGRLHVDHDHVTGEVRGLLCFHHNAMFGQAHDDPQILLDAIAYLASPPAPAVLGDREEIFA